VNEAAETPFHGGELELQERAGWREKLAKGAPRFIRDHMTDQHREFFAQLPFVAVGMLDAHARPWAGLLAGPPGFMSTPDARHLEIRAEFPPSNPMASMVKESANVGLLGIEFPTRRRNRANGVIENVAPGGLRVRVEQAFGNCPQYIAAHDLEFRPATAFAAAAESQRLSQAAIGSIRAASTLFIASAAQPHATDRREACDVSHRGGDAGFVLVEDDPPRTRLWIPDYRGNNFFNTFGNILRHPRAGLAFPDFVRGRVLMLTGAAEVVWEDSRRGLVFLAEAGCWERIALGPRGLGREAGTVPPQRGDRGTRRPLSS
jgi:predicted pyridoxine 5'-phosphate oxidase superfamily flavin-nucleotide-binding protein